MCDFITRSYDYFSDYGMGISWTVVLTQDKESATELKYRGIITQQEYDYFQIDHRLGCRPEEEE